MTTDCLQDGASQEVEVVIVGSGPAGLSAASRASHLGLRYVLLEAKAHASDTVFQFQKGKHVMAEPGVLPLRSGLAFAAGTREAVLASWNQALIDQGLKIVYGKRLEALVRDEATRRFCLRCEDGTEYVSRAVVLAIGMQGNIRTLGVPGEHHPRVRYTLADAAEFHGQRIVVVGAGDAAVENALSLADDNTVSILNRDEEFSRCKEGNFNLLTGALKSGRLKAELRSRVLRVEECGGGAPLQVVIEGPQGEKALLCDQVIARLGATPPRKMVESFGVRFSSADPAALPVLSVHYESSVPGLYVVGALAGCPLIKQAMNQGHEVIDALLGRPMEAADEPLLREKFRPWRPGSSVADSLAAIAAALPVLQGLSALQLREFMLESSLHTPPPGSVIFERNEYTNSFFSIVAGEVEVEIESAPGTHRHVMLGAGEYFGEMGLISGRRRSATVRAGARCVLIETPRRAMLKLIASVDSVRRQIDAAFIQRAIARLGPMLAPEAIAELVAGGVEVRRYPAGATLFAEGDAADGLYLIRRGSVSVSLRAGERERVLSYVSAGNYVGEMALINDAPRSATVRAAVLTEVLVLNGAAFKSVLAKNPAWRALIEANMLRRVQQNIRREDDTPQNSDLIRFLIGQGLGEATDVLLIDEALCIQCDNCERACAETHEGTSRLKRDAGPTFANWHVPTSCRHCEHPHCMKDCPPDAIRRQANGEVVISDACIGCGNCERNCPYGVIGLAAQAAPRRGGLLSWLLLGLGRAPGEPGGAVADDAPKKAVKCDMCQGLPGGAACVRACPTGAAMRVVPETFLQTLRGEGSVT